MRTARGPAGAGGALLHVQRRSRVLRADGPRRNPIDGRARHGRRGRADLRSRSACRPQRGNALRPRSRRNRTRARPSIPKVTVIAGTRAGRGRHRIREIFRPVGGISTRRPGPSPPRTRNAARPSLPRSRRGCGRWTRCARSRRKPWRASTAPRRSSNSSPYRPRRGHWAPPRAYKLGVSARSAASR